MAEEMTDKQIRLNEASHNLAIGRANMMKLKELGVDTKDMEKTLDYLENQINILKRP